MIERLRNSEVPFDWMFIMFGVTLIATGFCAGAPHLQLMVWGVPTEAKVLEIEPSLEEMPIPNTEEQKDAEAAKGGPPERFATLEFPLTHLDERSGSRREAKGLPKGPLDGGSLDIDELRSQGIHETELKVPPGAVRGFEAARKSGDRIHILYRPSNPDYLLREKDLWRIATAAGITIGAGLLFFALAAWIRRG